MFTSATSFLTTIALLSVSGCAMPAENDRTDEVVALTTAALTELRLVDDLADPDAMAIGDAVYISGTLDGRRLPFWKLDSSGLRLDFIYDPSAVDPHHDYCNVWAPDLAQYSSEAGPTALVAFAGVQVPEGAGCGHIGHLEQRVLWASGPLDTLEFGSPNIADFGSVRSVETRECPPEGCDHAMRIDPSVFVDGERLWISYTYFEHGNRNATIGLHDPTHVIHNTRAREGEGVVSEAPEIFERDGHYYLLYSVSDFRDEYRLKYLMANSVEGLSDETAQTYTLTTPRYDRYGQLTQNAGHGGVVVCQGQYYVVYHVGKFFGGTLIRRHTVASTLEFEADGRIRPID